MTLMSQENVLLHLNYIKPFSWENLLFKSLIYIYCCLLLSF